MAIDIGSPATDRPSSLASGSTRFNVDNPANATGTLDTCEIYGSIGGTGLIFGTFFLVSGTTYQCRDSENVGSYSAGSTQTFTGLSIDVTTGDYLGHYITADGTIDRDTSGFAGIQTVTGEYIDIGDQASYGTLAGDTMSLYGTGTEAGGQTYYQNVGQGSMAIASTTAKVATFAKTVGGAAMTIASSLSAGLFFAQVVGGAALTIAGALSTIFHDIAEAVKTRWHFPTRSYDGTQADEIQGYGTAPEEITGYGTPKPRYKFPSDYE